MPWGVCLGWQWPLSSAPSAAGLALSRCILTPQTPPAHALPRPVHQPHALAFAKGF